MNVVDENGYLRGKYEHSDLIHRQIAFKEIYLKNRDKYPQPFSKYVVHHKDRDKQNNDVSNLEILTPEEHEKEHEGEFGDYSYSTPKDYDVFAFQDYSPSNLQEQGLFKNRKTSEETELRLKLYSAVFVISLFLGFIIKDETSSIFFVFVVVIPVMMWLVIMDFIFWCFLKLIG